MGDLVQPRPGVGRILERVVGAVGLDEGVLGQVRRELGVAQHPDQVGVDLAVMLLEELLDEDVGADVRRGRARHGDAPSGRLSWASWPIWSTGE